MSRSPLRCWLLCVLLAAPVLPARADDTPKGTDPPPAADGDKGEEGDRYQVPEAGLDELRKFIVSMLSFEPNSRSEAIEHQLKAVPAVRKAARRILKLEEDKTADVAKMARAVLLQLDIQELRAGGEVDAQAVVDQSLEFVKMIGPKAGGFEVELVATLGGALEDAGKDELAIATYSQGSELLVKSEDPRVVRAAKMIAGMGRRLDLPGKVLKIEGVTHAGDEFKLKSLRGKVVLVDFWATWCGPCLAEIPNMRRNYERFKDQGFEIVGISLDDDREALDGFLEQRELPWIILHEEDEGGHPAAAYYGIRGIPAMFLVDGQGKVISTNARGPVLTRILEEKFPNTPEPEDKPEDGDAGDLDAKK